MKNLVNQFSSFLNQNIIIISLIYIVLLISCAEIAPPPGGEEDKTKPFLISSNPTDGKVNVPIGNRIVLNFSEKVLKASGKSIFISPRPVEEPEIKWKNEEVEIIFSDSFKVNETYIISLSSGIADLRKNTLDSTGIIAFSTGPTLDTGRISGIVFQNDKPRGKLVVALYDELLLSDTTLYDSLYPTYYSQTNSEGEFSFEYLPQKRFRLIAFEDKNKDEYFNPSRESFAITDRPIQVGGNIDLENLSLSLTSEDTTKPGILSAVYTSDNLLKIRLSKPIKSGNISNNPGLISLTLENDSLNVVKCKSLLEEADNTAANLTLYAGVLEEGSYNINFSYDTSMPSISYENVIIKKTEDQTPPAIISFHPGKDPVLLDSLNITLKLSEPLNKNIITNSTFTIFNDNDTLKDVQSNWVDDFRIRVNSPSIGAGESYKLVVTEFELADNAGLVVGDSLIEYSFSTVDSVTLGSISGEVNITVSGKEDDPVILTLTNIDKKSDYKINVSNRIFNVAVVSGSYILSAHIDSDNNKEFTSGSVKPFKYSETITNYPDTVKVRARFETTGIIFDIK